MGGWEYAVLFAGEAFGFSHSASRAEIKVCEQSGVWKILLIVTDVNGQNVGSIATDYTSDGSLLHWQHSFADEQPIIVQSMARANEVQAFEVVSLDSDGIERRSFLPYDLGTLEPTPAWLLRAIFADLNTGDSGSLISATLNHADPSQDWVKVAQVKWKVNDDTVMTADGNIGAWRLDGIDEDRDSSCAIFIGKANRDILRLDMNCSKGALILARAGA